MEELPIQDNEKTLTFLVAGNTLPTAFGVAVAVTVAANATLKSKEQSTMEESLCCVQIKLVFLDSCCY